MKKTLLLCLAVAIAHGCNAPVERPDPAASRRQFHYHRSFQFYSPNREFNFELAKLASSHNIEREYGYISTRSGRWDLLEEVASVEWNLGPSLEDLWDYMAADDVAVPLREVLPLLRAIEKFHDSAKLVDMNNALYLNKPEFGKHYAEFHNAWKSFNSEIRSYIRQQQTIPLQEDLMEYVLRIYLSNYETFWGHPPRLPTPPRPPRKYFID